jgi:hypothetical protein
LAGCGKFRAGAVHSLPFVFIVREALKGVQKWQKAML